MTLLRIHVVLALSTALLWMITLRNAWGIFLHKQSLNYRKLPPLREGHRGTALTCTAFLLASFLSGYLSPQSFGGPSSILHRLSAALLLPVASAAVLLGLRCHRRHAPPLFHAALSATATVLLVLLLCSGTIMMVAGW